jgi:hypothetical protein
VRTTQAGAGRGLRDRSAAAGDFQRKGEEFTAKVAKVAKIRRRIQGSSSLNSFALFANFAVKSSAGDGIEKSESSY